MFKKTQCVSIFIFIDQIIHIHILRIDATLFTNHLSINIICKSMQHFIQNQFINQHFVRNQFINQKYIQIIYQSTLFTNQCNTIYKITSIHQSTLFTNHLLINIIYKIKSIYKTNSNNTSKHVFYT